MDNHGIVRDGLALSIPQQEDMEVVGQAMDGHAAVQLTRELSLNLVLMAEGNSPKQTAMRLFIRPKAVEAHRLRIMNKPDIDNVALLTRYAIQEGLTPPESQPRDAEIRNSKHEIRNKSQASMTQTLTPDSGPRSDFRILNIRACFGFRNSDFGFGSDDHTAKPAKTSRVYRVLFLNASTAFIVSGDPASTACSSTSNGLTPIWSRRSAKRG